MPPVGFEPIISAGERPQTYALDCAATGIGALYQVGNRTEYGMETITNCCKEESNPQQLY
jgi:hypothetical protein